MNNLVEANSAQIPLQRVSGVVRPPARAFLHLPA